MKTISLIGALFMAFLMVSPSLAGETNEQTPTQSHYWNGVWQDFKKDWQQIGKSAKDTGETIGQSIKKEAEEMPENMRRGYEEAESDAKTISGSGSETASEK